jgi:hypothetical protein
MKYCSSPKGGRLIDTLSAIEKRLAAMSNTFGNCDEVTSSPQNSGFKRKLISMLRLCLDKVGAEHSVSKAKTVLELLRDLNTELKEFNKFKWKKFIIILMLLMALYYLLLQEKIHKARNTIEIAVALNTENLVSILEGLCLYDNPYDRKFNLIQFMFPRWYFVKYLDHIQKTEIHFTGMQR